MKYTIAPDRRALTIEASPSDVARLRKMTTRDRRDVNPDHWSIFTDQGLRILQPYQVGLEIGGLFIVGFISKDVPVQSPPGEYAGCSGGSDWYYPVTEWWEWRANHRTPLLEQLLRSGKAELLKPNQS